MDEQKFLDAVILSSDEMIAQIQKERETRKETAKQKRRAWYARNITRIKLQREKKKQADKKEREYQDYGQSLSLEELGCRCQFTSPPCSYCTSPECIRCGVELSEHDGDIKLCEECYTSDLESRE